MHVPSRSALDMIAIRIRGHNHTGPEDEGEAGPQQKDTETAFESTRSLFSRHLGSVRAHTRQGCRGHFRLARRESMRHGLFTATPCCPCPQKLKGGTRLPGTLSTARPGGAERTASRLTRFCMVLPGRSTTRINPNPRRTGQGGLPGLHALQTCLHRET